MGKFRVGEVVTYIGPTGPAINPAMHGAECEILEIVSLPNGDYLCKFPDFHSGHRDGLWACYEKDLRRIDPPAQYDGNRASSWESVVVWEPNKVRVADKEGA